MQDIYFYAVKSTERIKQLQGIIQACRDANVAPPEQAERELELSSFLLKDDHQAITETWHEDNVSIDIDLRKLPADTSVLRVVRTP